MQRYTTPAMVFHWLIAILIICAFTVGLIVADLPISPSKLRYTNYHKWTGITILGLAALRLLWRSTHKPPAYPASMPAWRNITRPCVAAHIDQPNKMGSTSISPALASCSAVRKARSAS